MNDRTMTTGEELFWLGATLTVGLIISTVLATGMVERVKLANQTIVLKGCAERLIDSDFISWRASFSAQASQMADAYKKVKKDLSTVLDYLGKEGVPQDEIDVSSISTRALYARDEQGRTTDAVTGYCLSQGVHIRSNDLATVSRISRECTDLIERNVEINSEAPDYFYTKVFVIFIVVGSCNAVNVEQLKLEMLGAAARDARRRAEQLAKDSGSKVGALRSTSQGVFQITPG